MAYRKTFEVKVDYITKENILERMEQRKNFVIVDTIWTHKDNRHRLKGAKTIPYPDVLDRRRELEGYDEVIVYCTKHTCPGSKIIAIGLQLLDVPNVKVYEGGIREWMDHGLPVDEYADLQNPSLA